MHKMITLSLALLISSVIQIPAHAAIFDPVDSRYKNIGIVNAPTALNIRAQPRSDSNVIGLILNLSLIHI